MRAAEAHPVFDKYDTLYLLGLPFGFEPGLDALFTKGIGKFRPTVAMWELCLDRIEDGIPQLVVTSEAMTLDRGFALAPFEAMLLCKLQIDCRGAILLVAIGDGFTLVVHTINADVQVWVLAVEVTSDETLGTAVAHASQVF